MKYKVGDKLFWVDENGIGYRARVAYISPTPGDKRPYWVRLLDGHERGFDAWVAESELR